MSESKAPRRPGGRRPIPPLIFLVVLAVLALGVWWQVIRKDETRSAEANAPCTLTASAEEIAELSNLGNIQLNVLNGSQTNGLAASIQADLNGRGFTTLEIGNVGGAGQAGAGKIEYGSGYAFEAHVVAAHFEGFAIERSNHVTDGTLTVIAGQEYAGMVDVAAAEEAVAKLVDEEAKVVAGCSPAEA